ncbi:serine protease [Raineyella sp.]|uniref:S1C family serine protease n=1 Tax=Raineyella sp. TaxID=1911550 RepID=UPI002B1EA196|nr:serine protease [Raineyella sp.]MEA5155954.1 serine protease [Raineyella sp.]
MITATAEPVLTWDRVLTQTRSSVLTVRTASCDESTAMGSGFAVGPDLVMTAAHVVDTASTASVQFDDGRIVKAELVGYDHSSDSALLRTAQPLGVPALSLVPGDPVQGTELAVLGFPLDMPHIVIAQGVVSAVHQPVHYSRFSVDDAFVTDAATNAGNSGGPVIDRQGHVIGLVSGGRQWVQQGEAVEPVQGMNYIIPSPQLAADLARWKDAPSSGFPACHGGPRAEQKQGKTVPTVDVTVNSTDGNARAVAATLAVHGQSINEGNYSSAWQLFTNSMKTNMHDLDTWSAGLTTSYWRSITVSSVTRQGNSASAEVVLTTQQSAKDGFHGQTCSVSSMHYRLILTQGVWLIDRAQRPTDPTPC